MEQNSTTLPEMPLDTFRRKDVIESDGGTMEALGNDCHEQDMDLDSGSESNDVPTNIEEDISDSFGDEDEGDPPVVQKPQLPFKSPNSEGWDQFKAKHSDLYAYDIELKKMRQSSRMEDSIPQDEDLRVMRPDYQQQLSYSSQMGPSGSMVGPPGSMPRMGPVPLPSFMHATSMSGPNLGPPASTMKSSASFVCEDCPSTFRTKRELQAHIHEANHHNLRLVCAWCEEEKIRSFKYVQDLRRHVESFHPTIHQRLLPQVLSSDNCFFFCQNPEDYHKLNKSSPYFSPEAIFARDLIMKWAEKRTPGVSQWVHGWQIAKPKSSSLSTAPTSTTSAESSLPTPLSPPPTKILKRNHTPELRLESIIISSEVKAYVSSESRILLVRIDPNILQNQKYMDSLTRKLTSIHHDFIHPAGTWKILINTDFKQQCADLLGIPLSGILTLLHQPSPSFKAPRLLATTTTLTQPPATTTTTTTPATLTPPPATMTTPPATMTTAPATTTTTTPPATLTPPPAALTPATTSTTTPPATTTTPPATLTPPPATLTTPQATTTTTTPPATLTPPAATLTTPQATTTTTTPPATLTPPAATTSTHTLSSLFDYDEDTDSSRSPTPCSLHTGATPDPYFSPITSSAQDPIQSSSSTPYEPAPSRPPTQPSFVYQPTPKPLVAAELAKNLLVNGSLPILPPGRRDWSMVPDESVILTSNLKWPPHNWSTFSSEQKLLAAKYAAMTMEQQQHSSFKPISPDHLLGKYNFLILPSTTTSLASFFSRMQAANYHVVKSICMGTSDLSCTEQLDVIKSFQPGPSSDITDRITHVPLRLQK